ncbi:hypothetical protein [Ferrimonas senticii]|uniref:hypothetical protein n=1 Tax=Ferrimonas senticii TaxID=394566 RepID=UPI0003F83212|nr:hypothetical protein [Ferrimonas senticii]
MSDKFHYRRALSGKWQMAEHAKTVESAIAMEALVHQYFGGATTIGAVANRITELVLASQPELLVEQHDIEPGRLLQMLALAAQSTVLSSLEEEHPSQRSMLILTVANHFACKQYHPELEPPLQALQQQIQTLHQHWQNLLTQRRASQRNMGR